MAINGSSTQYAYAGALAGVVTRCCCQPLDVLKIRHQLQVDGAKNAKYKGVFQASCVIIKEEGLLGLWKGTMSAQLLSVTFGACQMSTYKTVKSGMSSKYGGKKNQLWIEFTAGACSGVAATYRSYPFDIIRTRLVVQAEPKYYEGMVDGIVKLGAKEGWRSYFRGVVPAALQQAPLAGLIFTWKEVYTQLWHWCLSHIKYAPSRDMSVERSFVTSLLAGLTAKGLVYPLDVMKKRLQIQGFGQSGIAVPRVMQCQTLRQCFLATLRNEGVGGLFKGMYPAIVKSGATTAIYFTSVDIIMNLLQV